MTVFKYTLIVFASVILQIGNIYAANIYATQGASTIEGDSVNGNWSKNGVYGGSSVIIALISFELTGFSTDEILHIACLLGVIIYRSREVIMSYFSKY